MKIFYMLKSKSRFTLLIVCLLISVVSCTKCKVCTVYDSNNNIVRNEERVCGDNKAREDFELNIKSNANGLGGRYECRTENK